MQSSFGLALRALIMLGFLIIVPGIAIFGRGFPDVVRSLIDGQLPGGKAVANSNTSASKLPPAPRYGQSGGGFSATAMTAPPHSPASVAPAVPPLMHASAAGPNQLLGFQPPTAGSPVDRASFHAPAGPPMPPALAQQSLPTPPVNIEVQPSAATIPALRTQQPAPSPPQAVDQVQQRLQQLGASFYRLEKLGERGELFRFSCHMPWGDTTGGDRVFQAIESSAELAMNQVLAEVEAWRR